MRLLNRLNLNDVVLVIIKSAFEIQHVGFEGAHENGKSFLIHGRRHRRIDPKTLVLNERSAAADADRQAAAAQLVEHADFFVQAQRMIKRQHIDERA
jgi:hypothetical protein